MVCLRDLEDAQFISIGCGDSIKSMVVHGEEQYDGKSKEGFFFIFISGGDSAAATLH